MKTNITRALLITAVAMVAIASPEPTFARGQNRSGANELSGTSWKLVKLQGGDETISVPDDGSKYTITFERNGRVTSRVDCNRGSSTWKASGGNKLHFGSWSMTRAKCAPGSLHDRIVTEGAAVSSYSIENGRLFLSGMAAGGYYELEPVTSGRRP